jgi:hypothetical protein
MNPEIYNKPVFTVKQIAKDSKPILYVIHNSEDEWQFLPNEEVSTNDIMITKLINILKIDPSIKDILWIPESMEASRKEIGGEWTTNIFTE